MRDEGSDDKGQHELDEGDIKALFDKMADRVEDAGDDSREFFSMLVRTALRYRDTLMHSSGEALTVGETRTALDVFMEAMRSHEMPEGLDRRVHDLVMLWLEEVKEKIHH